jgi:DNA-binding CsgD family transcriptional regulator
VLKFLGISVININSTTIKIGAFIEMIILSIAVLYRVKILKIENRQMKDEIIKYSKEIKELSTNNEDEKKNNLEALSIREKEIFCLIVIKKTNKEISTELNISINTVKFHVKNIYEKLDIKSRKEAIKLEVSID